MKENLKDYGEMSEKSLKYQGTIKNVTNSELAINNHTDQLMKYNQ